MLIAPRLHDAPPPTHNCMQGAKQRKALVVELRTEQARRSEREISDDQWAARVHELSQQTEAAMGEAARHLAALEELKVRQSEPTDCIGLPSDCF